MPFYISKNIMARLVYKFKRYVWSKNLNFYDKKNTMKKSSNWKSTDKIIKVNVEVVIKIAVYKRLKGYGGN